MKHLKKQMNVVFVHIHLSIHKRRIQCMKSQITEMNLVFYSHMYKQRLHRNLVFVNQTSKQEKKMPLNNNVFLLSVPYGSWFNHVKKWLEHRNDPNLLVVKFEDLKTDLTNGVSKIAEFLGRPVSGDRAATIAAKCQFDNVKKEGQLEKPEKGNVGISLYLRKGKFCQRFYIAPFRILHIFNIDVLLD